MRIAWFSQYSNNSSSAFLSELLLPVLFQEHKVILYGNWEGRACGQEVHHFLTAKKHHQQSSYDYFVYHLEEGEGGLPARMHASMVPGIVVVHDVLCTTAAPPAFFHSPWEEVVQHLTDSLHPWHEKDVWSSLRDDPFIHRELSLSYGALFINPWACGEARRRILSPISLSLPIEKRFQTIPYPSFAEETSENNDLLPFEMKKFELGGVGSPSVESRMHNIFHALKLLKDEGQVVTFLWLIGEHELGAAQSLLKEFSVEDQVTLQTGRSPKKWKQCVQHIQTAVHLHYSVFGHLMPYVNISQAEGLPLLLSEFGEGAYYREDQTVLSVPGSSEVFQLKNTIADIVRVPRVSGREEISAEYVAHEISFFLQQLHPFVREANVRWEQLQQRARDEVLRRIS